ncbi:IQ domain-containing protein D, partial [Merops nubicus]
KMLDPCWLKPDSMEMERVVTVLDKTIAKLEMSSLIPRVIDSPDRFAGLLGPEITKSLAEHQELANEMEHLLASSGEGTTVRAEEQQHCLCLLQQRLKRSARNVLRLLLANPSLCQALKSEAWGTESPAERFIKAFGEFRDFMLERLLTSPVEEEKKIQLTEDISLQIKQNTETITALQAELAAAIQTREEEGITDKSVSLVPAEGSTRSCGPQTATVSLGLAPGALVLALPQMAVPVGLTPRGKPSKGPFGFRECPMGTPKPGQTRCTCLGFILQRKSRVEMEIVNWIQKYDTDMAEKQAEYEEVHAAYTEEKAQLSLLMEKRAVLLQEYSQIEEERRIRQKKEEEALEEFHTRSLAATCIQAFWRGYLVRRLFKPKKKKTTTKKGKGKGK